MGSPAQNLRIPERLRPWYEAGLELVLAPELARARREAASRPGVRSFARPVVRPSAHPSAREGFRGPAREARAAGPHPALQAASPDARGVAGRPTPATAAAAPGAPNEATFGPAAQDVAHDVGHDVGHDAGHDPSGRPGHEFGRGSGRDSGRRRHAPVPSDHPVAPRTLDLPAPWGGFRVPPAPRIAWTYFDLGLDLGGRADAGRRTLFRSLVRDLAWPQGTIAFWPAAVLAAVEAGALAPDSGLFWRGVDAMGLRQVACFGRRALSVICPGAEPSAVRHITEAGHVVLILPGPGDLVDLLPHERHRAVRALAELDF